MELSNEPYAPVALFPRKDASTHEVGGFVGPQIVFGPSDKDKNRIVGV
jgi:hypothetical protein